MTISEAISISLVCGYLIGYAIGYAIARRLHRKPPVIVGARIETTLVVDPEVLKQVNAAIVTAWLEAHEMTWMPKGAVFDSNRVIK